jgi:hypothetical protein
MLAYHSTMAETQDITWPMLAFLLGVNLLALIWKIAKQVKKSSCCGGTVEMRTPPDSPELGSQTNIV